eukprot:6321909-Amphidinium_carterae.2
MMMQVKGGLYGGVWTCGVPHECIASQDMGQRHMVELDLVQFFILDEADRMLDMGFEPQAGVYNDSPKRQSQSEP